MRLPRLFPRPRPAASRAQASGDPGVQYRKVRHAFGLDISDRSLKAVELKRRGGDLVLAAYSQLDLPENIVHRGAIVDAPALQRAIRELLGRAVPRPITTRTAVVSVGEAGMFLRPFEFPRALSEAQVRRALPYEAEGELPIAMHDMVTAVQFHRSREDDRHVLFAAAPAELVTRTLRVLASAGLQPVVLETESLALARALVGGLEEPVLLLDIGGCASSVTTVERGEVHGSVSVLRVALQPR